MQVLHGQLMRGFITFSLGAIATSALAQGPAPRGRPALATAVRQFVAVDTSSVALTHVRVIDGTGAAPRADQTILVESGRIAAIGDAGQVRVPPNAQVLDISNGGFFAYDPAVTNGIRVAAGNLVGDSKAKVTYAFTYK